MRVTFVRPGVKFLPGMAYISLKYNNNLPESTLARALLC